MSKHNRGHQVAPTPSETVPPTVTGENQTRWNMTTPVTPTTTAVNFDTGEVVQTPPPGAPTGEQPTTAATAAVFEAPKTLPGDKVEQPLTETSLPVTDQDSFNKALKARTDAIEAKYKKDIAELQKKAAEYDKIEDAKKTELERLNEKLAELQTSATTAKTQAVDANYRSSVIAEAAKLGFADPNDAIGLLDKSKLVKDDGTVDGVSEALAALLQSKPYLKGKAASVQISPANPSKDASIPTRTDADRHREYFGGGGSPFWTGGGVVMGNK